MTIGKQTAAILGFAFVAMWIATNLGYAVLCLVGAALFYLAAGVVAGEIDLGELQSRLPRGSRLSGYPSPRVPGERRSVLR